MYIKFNVTLISTETWYWVTVNASWTIWSVLFSFSRFSLLLHIVHFPPPVLCNLALFLLSFLLFIQERIIERLKEQREKEEREKGDEMETSKKELKELREKVSQLQAELADREVQSPQTCWLWSENIRKCAISFPTNLFDMPQDKEVKSHLNIGNSQAPATGNNNLSWFFFQ